MSRHVIVGAGPVGSTTAQQLAAAGHDVRIITRSGSGPVDAAIERVAADVTQPGVLERLAAGADTLYNCANPPYHRWVAEWPPLAHALLTAAETSGAVLVTMSNIYGYGPLDHPMTEDDPIRATTKKGPIRARMWADALAAHQAGRIRATEARASDFFGPGVTNSHLGEQMVAPVLRGKTARVVGNPDMPHSWTYVPDVARALVVLGTDESALGRPWHVPTAPAITQREALTRMARRAGAPTPRISPTPTWVLKAAGLFSPMTRELVEMAYQFARPFVMDSSAFAETFGLQATPIDEALDATADWWRDHLKPSDRLVTFVQPAVRK